MKLLITNLKANTEDFKLVICVPNHSYYTVLRRIVFTDTTIVFAISPPVIFLNVRTKHYPV